MDQVQIMNSDLENTPSLFCVYFKFIESHCDKAVATMCIGLGQVVLLTIVASDNKNQHPI